MTTSTAVRTNTYPGKCSLCGCQVPAQAGVLLKGDTGWIVQHLPGKCIEKAAPAIDSSAAQFVPEGRYAVEVDGKLGFFRVQKPTEGKWAGYTFVKQFASDNEFPVKGQRRNVVLAEIAFDVKAALLRYGQEIGKCGHCGRTLTDEASRAAGIGPICAGKLGW